MIRVRIRQGRVELLDPIPEEWEGQTFQLVALTPDDPMLDLEEALAALKALGPTEYEPGEREMIAEAMAERKRLSLVPVPESTDREP